MNYVTQLTLRDLELARKLAGFVPSEVFDIHAHPFRAIDFAPGAFAFLKDQRELGCREHRRDTLRYMSAMGATQMHGLYFGMPHRTADRTSVNDWLAAEVKAHGTPLSRGLMLISPADDPAVVADALRSRKFVGLKVYHIYAGSDATMQARIEEYAPEWMWELLHEIRGVLMLHIVRDGAIEDPVNQRSLRRLCRAYPNAKVILAHVARSFSYRNARAGLHTIADLDNAVVDTSAICESEAFRCALDVLGPQRVLWGSDFSVSELRGRCVTTGQLFFWLHPELIRPEYRSPTSADMTLIGVESLTALREACTDSGLTRCDIEDVFRRNALRLLAPHLPAAEPPPRTGIELWQHARTLISGGTGLLSKRAEMFDAKAWPAYFSRSRGCESWDLAGRRYVDMAGGVGAILLGYADPDVDAAVRRRIAAGTYSSLVNPQEVELAEILLQLHPWAGKVRYARGGGDALAVAVRTARAATGRSGIAFCGYHGWHDWYLAANLGETNALDGHLLPGLEPKGVPRELKGTAEPFKFNDLASLEVALAKLGNNLAAVVMEPMRAQFPQDDFVRKVAARCRAAGGVFMVDEVSSGLRYGFPGALTRLGVEPDLVVYAKAMSNGYPFGAVMGRDAVMQAAEGSFISSSYWTDGVGTAAALAVLEKVRRLKVSELVWTRGERLQAGLRELALRHSACQLTVAGLPATPTITFGLGADAPLAQALYVRKLVGRGFLASTYHYVMLAHDDDKIASFLAAADETLGELSETIARGRLAEESGVPRKTSAFARLA
jgi:glutamate-1-semialdehyde 2,1-aminomutase